MCWDDPMLQVPSTEAANSALAGISHSIDLAAAWGQQWGPGFHHTAPVCCLYLLGLLHPCSGVAQLAQPKHACRQQRPQLGRLHVGRLVVGAAS
jgi:hypothetical protein